MTRMATFFKTTALGGLLVLLPLLLFCLVLSEIFSLILTLTKPIAAFFPQGFFDNAHFPVILSILFLVGASFVIGLALKSKTARRSGTWVETHTIEHLPVYRFVKALVAGLVGAKETSGFQPALLSIDEGVREFAYVVETFDNGEMTVLVPLAPAGFSGPVKIVPEDRVQLLDVGLGQVNLVLNHLGLGSKQILNGKV
ncbi:MAG: hypothetical protein HKP58_09625 [Desulfatitalea sp.]|nr:hypothetical protein [Desulfatitalea sp.]NNK00661.1 hypothetical protein [Desulfatitalea sp.]